MKLIVADDFSVLFIYLEINHELFLVILLKIGNLGFFITLKINIEITRNVFF